MRRAAVFKWWKRFRDGGTYVKDESLSGNTCSIILLELEVNGLQHVFEKWVERCK
jgi:hypothetical protein